MASELSIVVATFGEQSWVDLALRRAVPSALGQAEVVQHHGKTLAQARNEGARQASGDLLCFLDADDELAPGYVTAMLAAASPGFLLAPAVAYVDAAGTETGPVSLADRRIEHLNPCVIGTVVERWLFDGAGGFDDRWPIYEDWALWLACTRQGALIRHVDGAVYRAHTSDRSRNESLSAADRRRWYGAILAEHLA